MAAKKKAKKVAKKADKKAKLVNISIEYGDQTKDDYVNVKAKFDDGFLELSGEGITGTRYINLDGVQEFTIIDA